MVRLEVFLHDPRMPRRRHLHHPRRRHPRRLIPDHLLVS